MKQIDYLFFKIEDSDNGSCYLIKKVISTFLLIFFGASVALAQNPFITTWKTNNSGSSSSTQIKIPAVGNFSFYWESIEDSTINGNGEGSGEFTIDFPEEGLYKVSLTPSESNPFNQIQFGFSGDRKKLLSIDQWGDIEWASFNGAYTETTNLKVNATDAPNLENVTDMAFAFFDSGIGNEGNLNAWDVSSVVNMEAVFFGTKNFNQVLDAWNTENVEILKGMFAGTKIFNQPLDTWDVSNVEDMSFMFQDALKFNQPLNSWDVSNVENMSYMFSNTMVFNGEIDEWNVGSVTNMEGMFTLAYGFNQPLDSWEVSSVKNLSTMFSGAILFNQPLDSWDLSSNETLWAMFAGSAFDQNIGSWDFPNVTNMSNMLDGSAMSCENYSLTLLGWIENPILPSNVIFGANELTYSVDAAEARNELINSWGWIIEGDEEGDCTLLGVNEIKTNQFSVYPNPSNGIINIDSGENIDEIRVYDVSGKLIQSEKFVSKNKVQLDLNGFPKGLYIINLIIGNSQKSHKVILK